MKTILETDLSVDYKTRPDVLRNAVVQVKEGEIAGLVGQSGSGKTTFVLSLFGLLKERDAAVRGSVIIDGTEIRNLKSAELRAFRGRVVSLIPQNPAAALNPFLRLKTQLREAWIAHAANWKSTGLQRSLELLRQCGLPVDASFLDRYPDEISQGQAQRVLIAMALLHHPVLLVADEPTSALDLLTQRDILDLLASINAERRMSILLISHDLNVVAGLCHTIFVLYDGTIVESGATQQLLTSPRHSFTQRIVAAIPQISRTLCENRARPENT